MKIHRLFEAGDFVLHSGTKSDFRINCEALDRQDIEALANEINKRVPLFGVVEGVPRGGLRIATAMRRYATNNPADPLLIVDDVYSTGASMEEHRAGRDAIGMVIFTRRVPKQAWISALFVMSCAKDE